MKNGDVSLILKNVTTDDAGTYKCQVLERVREEMRLSSTITLIVDPPGQEIITAETEQDVTLPCQAPDNIIGIEWSRPDLNKEYVLLYRDGRSDPKHQHPSFVNRVYLKDKDMKDGDASLILKNVTTADNGSYECRVRTGTSRRKRAYLEVDPINIIYLSVVDPPGQPGGDTEDGGKEDEGEKDGGKEAGSVGLVIGLSIVAVVFSTVVLILIYRKIKQCNQDSHPPAAEPQIEMSESFLNSESPAAEYNDRNDLEANNCHDQSTRIPDVTLTLENELLHPPPQETAGLLSESDMRVQ
ncbi:unnamed protein product [Oreochromis niloticus]|nr:unnamed protein product [Mustela putorius furo]